MTNIANALSTRTWPNDIRYAFLLEYNGARRMSGELMGDKVEKLLRAAPKMQGFDDLNETRNVDKFVNTCKTMDLKYLAFRFGKGLAPTVAAQYQAHCAFFPDRWMTLWAFQTEEARDTFVDEYKKHHATC
jgi:hypothetical protein